MCYGPGRPQGLGPGRAAPPAARQAPGAQKGLAVHVPSTARRNTVLDRLGLLRNPNKGVWEPTHVGPHLGLIIDLKRGEFRAPEEKLIALAKAARSLLGRAASNKRWLPARQLASFAGKAQFLEVSR
eukprot:jgi/Tetstr1/461409/TSEL_006519.t1